MSLQEFYTQYRTLLRPMLRIGGSPPGRLGGQNRLCCPSERLAPGLSQEERTPAPPAAAALPRLGCIEGPHSTQPTL